jgi:mediator of replication checkpoint protein 1
MRTLARLVSWNKIQTGALADDCLAENPKKLAFLRAIEDRDEEDGIDYLGEMEEYQGIPGSQEEALQEAQQALPAPENELPNLTANIGTKRKLPADFEVSAPGKENVAPSMSHRRRPGLDGGTITKRATTIADIRESLSFLIDEPLVPNSQVSDNSDDEAEEDEDSDGPSRRVRQKRNDGNGSSVLTTVRASVVNRLTLSRNNSMGMDEDSQASGPVAFHTSNSISSGGFKIPSLLRRATTNLSSTSSNSSGATTPVTNENAVRMGGSKRSNIHFQAREAERMKKVQDADRRRTEGIRKSVVGKGRTSVLGNSLGSRNSGFE